MSSLSELLRTSLLVSLKSSQGEDVLHIVLVDNPIEFIVVAISYAVEHVPDIEYVVIKDRMGNSQRLVGIFNLQALCRAIEPRPRFLPLQSF